MIAKLHKLEQAYNRLTARERILVSVLSFVMLYSIFNLLLLSPIAEQRKNLLLTLKEQQGVLTKLHKQIEQISTAQSTSHPLREKQDALLKQKHSLDEDLELIAKGVVEPQQMVNVLKTLLKEQPQLHLIQVKNIPFEGEVSAKLNDVTKQKLYEHHLQLTVEGNYFAVLAYLQKVEQLQWRVFWDQLDYQVTQYPIARVIVKLHILSTKEALIRV